MNTPSIPSGGSMDATALKIQVGLLKKAQDIAAGQVQALLPRPVGSANAAGQGGLIDISA